MYDAETAWANSVEMAENKRWDEHDECGCEAICHKDHLKTDVFEDDCDFCKQEKCPDCNGTGWVLIVGRIPCYTCGNVGRVNL
jgi:hypothetical protein